MFLDFIRYPCHWEAVRSASISEYCFCANCLNTFKKAGGITPEGEVWIAWKCQQITNFVKEVNELVMKINPSLKLGVFTVPWRQDDFEGAIRRIIGQDRLELTPFIDLFAPMTYHKLTANDPEWIVKVNRDIHLQTGRPVLPVVQVMDEPSRLNPEEFEKVLTLTLDYTHDLMVFHADALLEDAEKIEVIRNILGA